MSKTPIIRRELRGDPDQDIKALAEKVGYRNSRAISRERRKMIFNGEIPDCRSKRAKRSGPKIVLPEGKTFQDVVRQGESLRAEGLGTPDIAKKVGLAYQAYCAVRDIVLLAEREDLAKADKARALSALELLTSTCQAAEPHDMIRNLATRVWGRRGGRSEKTVKARTERIGDALTYIVQMSADLAHMPLPHISTEKVEDYLGQITAARRALRVLIDNLREDTHYEDSTTTQGKVD